MTKHGITVDDLLKFSFLSDPQLSPDGNKVVFTKRTINESQNYQSSLYVKDITTNDITRFTQGDSNDFNPRWSPNGNTILFVSNRSGKNQVWKIGLNGGEAAQLTHFETGVSEPVFSPNGKQLLVTVPLADNDTLSTTNSSNSEEAADSDDQPKPYITTRLKYKSDAEGFLKDTYKQLVLVDLYSGDTIQLTNGSFDHFHGTFSPDGQRIAFTSNRSEDPDQTFTSDIYELELSSQELTKLTNSDGMFSTPNYSPDGKMLSVLGHKREYAGATLTRVWTIDLNSHQLTCLTDNWDVQAADVGINDMATGSGSPGAVWSNQNNAVYFQASHYGNTNIYQVSLDKQISKVIGGERQVYAFNLDEKQEHAVIAVSDNQTPGDLYLVSLANEEEQRLTKANQTLLNEKVVVDTEQINFTARDGLNLHGWIMKPVGFEEGNKYPVIVEIHGGPHMMYSNSFMHEFQVLTAKGYGVLFINPRGSHGYGQSFVDAVRGDYGGGDYEDILATVDYAVETFDWIDEQRLGVTGGSYGGFMTNWIVGHTNRFKAAVTQRSISNWLSFYGVSDIGYFFTEWELKTNLIEDPDTLWKHSPLRYVKNVETPLLLIHSEQDYRCPIEQGEQFYVALKQQHKPTKFVRFPNSNHELSRNGKPALRMSRLNEITEWFDTYL